MSIDLNPPSSFAICVPTIPQELDPILLSHNWWATEMEPCANLPKSNVDLVYLFPETVDLSIEFAIRKSFREHDLGRYFSGIHFSYANLEPEKNHYVRDADAAPPNEFGLKSGPNYQFFHMIEVLGPNYDSILQMETDCIPIRKGWLDRLCEIQSTQSNHWVSGSLYHGPTLPKPWTNHLNGNAIYQTGSKEFQEFFSNVWKSRIVDLVKFQRPELAFDCAVEEYFSTFSTNSNHSAEIKWTRKKFVADNYIANMAPSLNYPSNIPKISELQETHPETYLVHGSWLLAEVRNRLGVAQPKKPTPTPSGLEKPPIPNAWIWVKGFSLSENARFQGGEVSLPSSWRFRHLAFGKR